MSQPDNKINNLEYLNNIYTNYPNVENVQRQNLIELANENYCNNRSNNIPVCNQSEYILMIKLTILEILKEDNIRFGIEVDKLCFLVTQKLGRQIQFSNYGVCSFRDFI